MFPKTTALVILAALCLTAPAALAQAARGQIAAPGGSTQVAGDFDGDGDVDGRDFLTWQRH